jgi:mannosyltransferase
MNRLRQVFADPGIGLLIAAVTALALALRLINLGYSDLTFDETASYFVASKPLGEMLPYLLRAIHEHPPVYFVMLVGWMQLVGKSEVALRLLAVGCGVLSVPVMYQFGRKAINARAGLVAALLLALAPVHIFYSQTARMYTLLGLLALITWWLVLKLETSNRGRYWLMLTVCSLVGLGTHYYMALVIASQLAYWLVAGRRQRRLLLQWLLWFAVPLALTAVYVLTSSGARATLGAMFNHGLSVWLDAGPWRGLAASLLFGPHGNTLGMAVWGFLLIGVAFGIGLAVSNRAGVKREIGVLLLCAIGVPIGLILVLPETIAARYVIFVLFPVILALTVVVMWPLSWSIPRLRRWRALPVVVMLVALVVLDVTRLPYHYTALNSSYGRIIAYVRTQLQPGDGVIFNGPWQAIMQSYYPIGNVPAIYLPPQTPPALDPVTAEPALREFVKSHDRIWVLPVAIEQADPDRFVQRWLNEHWQRATDRDDVITYYAPPTTTLPILSTPIRFGNTLELQAAEVATTTLEAGSALMSNLTWQVLQAQPDDIQITLEAIDQVGNVWGQRIYRLSERLGDVRPVADGRPLVDRQAVPIDPGAPPGRYRLRVTPQRASTGETLTARNQPDALGYVLADLMVAARVQPMADQKVPGQPVGARYDDQLQLVAYQIPGDEYVQGGIVPVTLYWRALNGDRKVDVDVALVDATGQIIVQTSGPLGPEWYRAAQWQPRQVVATLAPLLIPARQQPGRYQLRVTVRDRAGQPVPAQGQINVPGFLGLWQTKAQEELAAWPVGEVNIAARQRNFDTPAVQQTVNIKFGDQIQLLGYDLDTSTAAPGGQLRVTFYWKALQAIDRNYVVFTHLIDAAGQQQGQRDSMPVDGRYPTPLWQQGEIVADTYTIDIDPRALGGDYTLDFGWYHSDDGARLLAIDANGARLRDDIAQLTNVTVSP